MYSCRLNDVVLTVIRKCYSIESMMESVHVIFDSSTSMMGESSMSDGEEESECAPTWPSSSFEGNTDPNGPRKCDVLMGRGKPFQNFPGNKRMVRIVSQFRGEYALKPRDQKRLYVETALDAVLKDGARFLRRVEVGDGSHRWEEVGRAAAAEKVWNALRSKAESKSRKIKRVTDQGDDHANAHQPHSTALPPLVDEMGESSTGSTGADRQLPPIDLGGISQSLQEQTSLVQSLSNELLRHLSNAAGVAAVLVATVTTGQAQLPQAPLPVAADTGMPAAQDLSMKRISEAVMGELLGAYFQGLVPTPRSVLHHPQAQHIAGNPRITGIPVAALRGVVPAIPAAIPPSVLMNQHGDLQQGQLMRQVISSLLRATEQADRQQ